MLELANVADSQGSRDIPLEPKCRRPDECPEFLMAVGAVFPKDGCWSVGNYKITNKEHSLDPWATSKMASSMHAGLLVDDQGFCECEEYIIQYAPICAVPSDIIQQHCICRTNHKFGCPVLQMRK